MPRMIAPVVCVAGTMTSSATWVTLSAMKLRRQLYKVLDRLCPKWALRRRLALLNREHHKQLNRAKSDFQRAAAESHYEQALDMVIDSSDELFSELLINEALIRFLPFDYVKYEDRPMGTRALTRATLIRLFDAVESDRRKVWEFRVKLIGTILTGLVGLAGALAGLFAILLRHRH
jgi:hypothetical protein